MFIHQVLWHFCGVGEYCQGFPNLFGLGKLGQTFSSKMPVTTASSMFIPERSNKRWIPGSSERPGHLIHQFVFHTNAEDHRKPGRVLGYQPQGTSYHWPKFSGKRWSISCHSPSMPGVLKAMSMQGRVKARPCSSGMSFVLLLINLEDIVTNQQESLLSQCYSVMKLLVDPSSD